MAANGPQQSGLLALCETVSAAATLLFGLVTGLVTLTFGLSGMFTVLAIGVLYVRWRQYTGQPCNPRQVTPEGNLDSAASVR